VDRRRPENIVETGLVARTEMRMRQPTRRGIRSPHRLKRVKDWQVDTDILGGVQWQTEAFTYYRLIGQIRKVEAVKANTLSACRLRLKRLNNEGEPEDTQDPRALRVWNALVGPHGGKRELMRKYGMLMDIAGEAFLIGVPTLDPEDAYLVEEQGDSPGLTWEFVSRQELRGDRPDLTRNKPGVIFRDAAGVASLATRPIPPSAYIARSWTPDPQWTELPDSAMRSVIPDAEEYVKLRDVVSGAIRQRMAAGLLLVPSSASFGSFDETLEEEGDWDDEADPLLVDLTRHMSAPLVDRRDSATFVPLILSGDAEDLKEIRMLDLSFGNQNIEWATPLREEKLRMISQTLDAPPETMEGRADLNHWCITAEDSQVLTARGWLGIDDFKPGDVVLSLNHETGRTEWHRSHDVYRADVVDLPMLSMDNNVHQSTTTLNHRWPILRRWCGDCGERPPEAKGRCLRCRKRAVRAQGRRDIEPATVRVERLVVTSAELRPTDQIVLGAEQDALPDGDSKQWTDAMVELVAWMSTDGCLRGEAKNGRRAVLIRQSPTANPAHCKSITEAATSALGPPTEGIWSLRTDDQVGQTEWRLSVGVVSSLVKDGVGTLENGRFNISPDWVKTLTKSQLHLFLATCEKANGHAQGSTHALFAKDQERLDAAELAAVLLGFRVSRTVHRQGESAFGSANLTRLSWGPKTTVKVGATTVENYTGRIWCPSVAPHHTILVRQNGKAFYTGNSGYSVDQELATKWVIPRGEQLAQFLSAQYLQPMLEKYEGIDDSEASRFVVVFDPSNITARADRGVTAIRLYDRRLLSGLATVEANGFADDDMPDEAEKAIRFLVDLVLRDPSILSEVSVAEALGLNTLSVDLEALAEALARPAAVGGGTMLELPADPDISERDEPPDGANDGYDPPDDVRKDAPDSGGGEVPPEAPDGAPMHVNPLEQLIHDLTLIADGVAETGVQRACSRLVSMSQKPGCDPAVGDRLRGRQKGQVFMLTSDEDLRRLGTTPEALMQGTWDAFVSKATLMISRYLSDQNGSTQRNVGAETAHVVDELVSRLQMQVLDTGGDRRFNGLVVDETLIGEIIESELGAVPLGVG
jgi:hypothetical protein